MSTPWSTLSWYCFSIYPLTRSTFTFTRSRIPHPRGCFLLSLFILIPFCWFCPTVASLLLQCLFIFCFFAFPRTKILCKKIFAPLIVFSFLFLIFHVYSKGSKYHSFWDRYSRNESMGYRWSAEERRGDVAPVILLWVVSLLGDHLLTQLLTLCTGSPSADMTEYADQVRSAAQELKALKMWVLLVLWCRRCW